MAHNGFLVQCDGCGKYADIDRWAEGFSLSRGYAVAREKGWKFGDSDLCPSCAKKSVQ